MEMIRRLFEDDSIIEEDEHSNTLSVILSNIFLFFLIFGMSATVDIRNMRHQLTNRFALGCGVLMQFIIMPALGYLAVVALRGRGLSESMGIALLVVTTSPGGSYSNWWCSVFNAGKFDSIRYRVWFFVRCCVCCSCVCVCVCACVLFRKTITYKS